MNYTRIFTLRGLRVSRFRQLDTARFSRAFKPAIVSCTIALFLSLSINVFAQGGATINGHVTDQDGANVARAEVHLHLRSGVKIFARTNEKGVFGFTGLGPGEYILEVVANGFATVTGRTVTLENSQTVTSDFQLDLASVNETVVVVANGTPQRTDEVSKAVTVIEAQQIEAQRDLMLSDALRGTPGLRVQQQGSPGALTSWRLRGLRNYDTSILLDGLRVRDASDINGSALPFLTDMMPVALDRVELLRGSGSSIYGTNAIGGVVNIIPSSGFGEPQFETSFEGGSLALFRERFQSSGGIGKRAGYSFGVSRLDVRNGVDGSDEYGNTVGGARFTFNATPSITIGANFYGTISNARVNNSPFALPGAFTTGEVNPSAIAGVTFQPDFNNPDAGRRNLLLLGSARFTHQVSEIFSYTVAYQHVTTRRRNYDGPLVDPRYTLYVPFGDFVFVGTNRGSTDTFDARTNIRLGGAHLVTAGLEFEREQLFQEFASLFGASPGTTDRQKTFAVFGQDQIFAYERRLQISIGVRAQFFKLRAEDRPEFLGTVEPKTSVTGDGSIAYFIRSTGTKLRVHVGNGFRAPSLFERFGQGTFSNLGFTRFGDPTIRDEQSISADGGFDQRLAKDRLLFGATYFYTRLQRVIDFEGAFQTDPLGLGRTSGYVNRPGGVSRGVETYLEAAAFRGANLRASYTYTNSDRFVPGLGLQRQFVIPTHLFGMTFSKRFRQLQFSFDVNHTGSYTAPLFTNDFSARADFIFEGYTKADFFSSYERVLNENTRVILFGGAENLFNETYFENGFRAPKFLARGGVMVRF